MLAIPLNPLFDEVTDFLASTPTLEAIIDFKPSESLDQHLQDLMDKNNREELSGEERTELDRFLQVNHLLIILQAKARLKLSEKI